MNIYYEFIYEYIHINTPKCIFAFLDTVKRDTCACQKTNDLFILVYKYRVAYQMYLHILLLSDPVVTFSLFLLC